MPVLAHKDGSYHPTSACKICSGPKGTGQPSRWGCFLAPYPHPSPHWAPQPQERNTTVLSTHTPRIQVSPNPVSKLQGVGDGGTQKDDGDVLRKHDEHLLPHDASLHTRGEAGQSGGREDGKARPTEDPTFTQHSPQHR